MVKRELLGHVDLLLVSFLDLRVHDPGPEHVSRGEGPGLMTNLLLHVLYSCIVT